MTAYVHVLDASGKLVPLQLAGDGGIKFSPSSDRRTQNATIPSGASVSGTIDLTSTSLLGFIAPAAWTAATLKLQGSPDDASWSDILDPDGVAVSSYAAVTAGAAYSIDVVAMLPYRYVRFVAGAAQGADRVFTVITRPLA